MPGKADALPEHPREYDEHERACGIKGRDLPAKPDPEEGYNDRV